jgi:CheY-like chemotaxis protein
MVHGLAEQSGGKLFLASERGKGTTAEVWLPVAASETGLKAGDSMPDQSDVTAPSLSLTILVVDDDDLVLSNTAEMLEDMGHTVLQAASGREALTLLRSTPGVDLLLTDHAMPEMTGSQLAAVVRIEQPELPIILASGYAHVPADERSDLCRLHKPVGQATLKRAIDTQFASHDTKVIRFPARKG